MKRQAYVLSVRRFLGRGIPFPPLCVCIFMLHLTRVAAVRISESETPIAELVMTEDVRHDLEEGCNLGWFTQVREASGWFSSGGSPRCGGSHLVVGFRLP